MKLIYRNFVLCDDDIVIVINIKYLENLSSTLQIVRPGGQSESQRYRYHSIDGDIFCEAKIVFHIWREDLKQVIHYYLIYDV